MQFNIESIKWPDSVYKTGKEKNSMRWASNRASVSFILFNSKTEYFCREEIYEQNIQHELSLLCSSIQSVYGAKISIFSSQSLQKKYVRDNPSINKYKGMKCSLLGLCTIHKHSVVI